MLISVYKSTENNKMEFSSSQIDSLQSEYIRLQCIQNQQTILFYSPSLVAAVLRVLTAELLVMKVHGIEHISTSFTALVEVSKHSP